MVWFLGDWVSKTPPATSSAATGDETGGSKTGQDEPGMPWNVPSGPSAIVQNVWQSLWNQFVELRSLWSYAVCGVRDYAFIPYIPALLGDQGLQDHVKSSKRKAQGYKYLLRSYSKPPNHNSVSNHLRRYDWIPRAHMRSVLTGHFLRVEPLHAPLRPFATPVNALVSNQKFLILRSSNNCKTSKPVFLVTGRGYIYIYKSRIISCCSPC